MKRLIALTALLVFTFAVAADKASVTSLAKDPAKFDNKVVVAVGKVAKFKAKTSRAGNKYYTFDLEEGKEHVAVYGRGELAPTPKDGDKVEVTGLFAKERKSGSAVFTNEIDATHKDGDKNGVKLVK